MKRYNKLSLLCIVAATIGLTACGNSQQKAAITEEVETVAVKVEKVTQQAVPQTSEFTATVEANIVNNISPLSPTRIDEIRVEVGDKVKKGQKLVAMNQSNLHQSKLQLDNLETEFNRLNELYKVGGATKSALDGARTQLDVAVSAYDYLLENTQLISPIDGIVTARNYDEGDMYGQMPVLTIQQISPVKLLINVSESLYTKIAKGMDVVVKADVYGGEEFAGKVSLVYPTIDAQTRTFPVEITVANKDARLRPGMFARITIDFGSIDYVLVPDQAIVKQQGSGGRYIYVYKDGKVSYQKVELGRQIGNKFEVKSGIESGDEVVISGITRLKDGIEVVLDNNPY